MSLKKYYEIENIVCSIVKTQWIIWTMGIMKYEKKCKDVLFKIISLLNDDQLVIITLYSG